MVHPTMAKRFLDSQRCPCTMLAGLSILSSLLHTLRFDMGRWHESLGAVLGLVSKGASLIPGEFEVEILFLDLHSFYDPFMDEVL